MTTTDTSWQPCASVGDGELLCTNCQEWKLDVEFSNARRREIRRGKHNECKVCAAIRGRERRARATAKEIAGGAPICERTSCTEIATQLLTNGQFRNQVPISRRALHLLSGRGVPVCVGCFTRATAVSSVEGDFGDSAPRWNVAHARRIA